MSKKKVETWKYFDCKSCNEMTYFNSDMICSLRVSLDKDGVPNCNSLCEYVSSCNYYKKKVTSR